MPTTSFTHYIVRKGRKTLLNTVAPKEYIKLLLHLKSLTPFRVSLQHHDNKQTFVSTIIEVSQKKE